MKVAAACRNLEDGKNHVLIKRQVGLEWTGACLWTLFVDGNGKLTFTFSSEGEFGPQQGVSVATEEKFLEQNNDTDSAEEVWHHVAVAVDSSRSRWTAKQQLLSYQDPISVSLFVDGERVAGPTSLLPPPLKLRLPSNEEEGKEEGDLGASLLLIGPDLSGWRLTELRLWSDIRSENELNQNRDVCLSLAIKRKRQQQRVKGANTKKIFTPFRAIDLTTLMPYSESSGVLLPPKYGQDYHTGSSNSNAIRPENKTGGVQNSKSAFLPLPTKGTGAIGMKTTPLLSNPLSAPSVSSTTVVMEATTEAPATGLSSAARARLMRRGSTQPIAAPTSALPKAVANPSPAVAIPPFLSLAHSGSTLNSSDIALASSFTKLLWLPVQAAALRTSIFGGYLSGKNPLTGDVSLREFSFELIKWDSFSQESLQILRLIHISKSQTNISSLIVAPIAGSAGFRIAVYDQRYIFVADLTSWLERDKEPLVVPSSYSTGSSTLLTRVCEVPMKSTPLVFWLILSPALLLLVTHQAAFTLPLPQPTPGAPVAAPPSASPKPIKILERIDIPPNSRSVIFALRGIK